MLFLVAEVRTSGVDAEDRQQKLRIVFQLDCVDADLHVLPSIEWLHRELIHFDFVVQSMHGCTRCFSDFTRYLALGKIFTHRRSSFGVLAVIEDSSIIYNFTKMMVKSLAQTLNSSISKVLEPASSRHVSIVVCKRELQ